jgi:hypothetical protein
VDNPIPRTILASVRASYFALLQALPSPLGDLGRALLTRITPEQWTLEWALPYWLGQALDFPSDLSTNVVLGNLLGLAYIRMQDDLIDGEIPSENRLPAALLAHQFYREATLQYHELFSGDSAFWDYFRLWLDQWVSATLRSNTAGPLPWSDYTEQDYVRLAERGAPLKICCAAACLLANRRDAIANLSTALDFTLVGMVLLDHFHDWGQDLDAGRYNTFVAYCSDLPQLPANRAENSERVRERLYLGDGGRPYLELIRANLERARQTPLAIDLPQLAEYLVNLEQRAIAYFESLTGQHRRVVHDVAEKIFGAALLADAPKGEQRSASQTIPSHISTQSDLR